MRLMHAGTVHLHLAHASHARRHSAPAPSSCVSCTQAQCTCTWLMPFTCSWHHGCTVLQPAPVCLPPCRWGCGTPPSPRCYGCPTASLMQPTCLLIEATPALHSPAVRRPQAVRACVIAGHVIRPNQRLPQVLAVAGQRDVGSSGNEDACRVQVKRRFPRQPHAQPWPSAH